MPIPVLLPFSPEWQPTAGSTFTVGSVHTAVYAHWHQRTTNTEMVIYPTVDNIGDGTPSWFKPGYRLVASRWDGSNAFEPAQVKLVSMTEELQAKNNSITFTLPLTSPDINKIKEPYTEWKVLRGRKLIGGGVITDRRTDSSGMVADFKGQGYRWYFDHRLVNRMPRRELVKNRSFKEGMKHWRLGFDPRHADGPPKYAIVTDHVYSMDNGDKLALKLEGASIEHDSFAYQHFGWIVPSSHTDGDEFTLTAWVYVPSTEYKAPAYGERGLMLELFSSFNEDGTPDDRDNISLKFAAAPINDDTPKDKWVKMVATIGVPRSKRKAVVEDGQNGFYRMTEDTQYVSFRLYPPHGIAYWDEVSLTYNERLVYHQTEQTVILADVINLGQDPDLGKSDLAINPFFASKSKVRRNKTYLFGNDQTVNEIIDEYTSLERGVDVDITPTISGERWFRQFYPHKGQYKKKYALELGRNLSEFTVERQGGKVGNSILVKGYDTDKGQATAHVVDTTDDANGLVLETAYTATPGSSITSLDDQAARGLRRFRKVVTVIRVKTYNTVGQEYWDYLQTGDTTDLKIVHKEFSTHGIYRIIRKTLDFSTGCVDFELVAKEYAYDALA